MSATIDKQKALRKHKAIATGLFFAMAILYVVCVVSHQHYPSQSWVLYVKAFSEAAMVGALADWFAVTALFNHPLGLKIPHTNIIQKSQQSIGDNLGTFIVENFLNAQNIKPYISQLDVVKPVLEWINTGNNKAYLAQEITKIAAEILDKMEDDDMVRWIEKQGSVIVREIKLPVIAYNFLNYIAEAKELDQAIESVGEKIIAFITSQKTFIEDKVKDNSYFFVPNFVNHKVADKIEAGIIQFVSEIITQQEHPTRLEIKSKIKELADNINTNLVWEERLNQRRDELLTEELMKDYATKIWQYLKLNLQTLMVEQQSTVSSKIENFIGEFAQDLAGNEGKVKNINTWVQSKAYYYALKNNVKIADLISDTVSKWDAKALSEKLELEVGKDLQYIRINGTIVGGLVGLTIYSLTRLLL